MLKFEVYTVEKDSEKEFGPKKGDVRVKFPEYDIDHCVETDENGELYFSVPNIIGKPDSLEDRLFIGRIKDAYDMIVNGDGDAIQTSAIFGFRTIHVVKFVNYDYGKQIREKFLEGWKDSKFGWGIEAGNGNSFEGFSAVCENMTTYNRYLSPAENSVPFFFETEKDAQSKMDEILSICKDCTDRYYRARSRDEQKNILNNMEKEYGNFSVYLNYLCSKDAANSSEKEYKFRVVQSVR